ncbi:MAG: imelysin family protein [Thiohalocapsa sp.]
MDNNMHLVAITAALLLPAIAGGVRADWTTAHLALLDEHVIPRYEALAETTAGLAADADRFCNAPDAKGLERVRRDYHQVMDAWQAVAHISFGPVELFMRRERFELWPDKHGTGARQLRALLVAQDREMLAQEAFPRGSVAVQGLPALERLLFESDIDPASFGSTDGPGYRCALGQAIAANLKHMAEETLDAWTSPTSNASSAFGSSDEVAALFLRDLRTTVQKIADLKLRRPMGKDPTRAKPERAESWRSQRSLQNIRINLQAARNLYATCFAPVVASEAKTPELDRRIRAAFDEAIDGTALDEPLQDLIADPARRTSLEQLLASVQTLEQMIASELPGALGLAIGFNALDGD